ncbi:hypothetical protein ACFSTC_02060 [Nonomuraea ferruginea]
MYGPDSALDLAPGVRKVLDDPASLGPPADVAFRHHAPEQLGEMADDVAPGTTGSGRERLAAALAEPGKLIEEVPPESRAALEQLAWGPPTGRVPNARREVRVASARSPIEQLLARGLLAAAGEESVTLPREVGLYLRGGRVHRDLLAQPPSLEGTARGQELADRTAAGQAFAFVRAVEELCERWSIEPPGVLRTGGPGRARHEAHGGRARPARLGGRAGGGGRVRVGADRGGRQRRRRVAADQRLRPVAGQVDRRPLGGAGRGLAGDGPGARTGRRA